MAMSPTSNGYAKLSMDDGSEEIKIPVPWGHIAGKWWGPRNTQPIIAIHGWQDNAGSFDGLALYLKQEGVSLLCIDLPGHGFSSHYPKGQYYYVFWDGVTVLRRIVKHFQWNKITIIGHSLGGAIAFLYAAVYPKDVEKFVSIDIAAPIARDPVNVIDQLGDSVDRFLKYENFESDKFPGYVYEEAIDVVEFGYKGSVTRKSCEILMKRGMKPAKDRPGTYYFSRDPRLKTMGLGFFSLDQVLEFASRIRCDVLNVRADPGMKFDKPEYYDAVMDKIKAHANRTEYHIVPGTHHVHLNNPECVAGIISEFLEL